MQWIVFIMISLPFIIAWFDPEMVRQYFEISLAVIPEWFQKVFLSITGVIFGVAQLKNVASTISDSFLKSKNVDVSKLKSIASSKIIRPKEKYDVFNDK